MTIPLTNLTGAGVRVAIIDSGVNPAHPHVNGVAGGIHITAHGEESNYLDFIGHGTAVAGAIREKAPDASLYAVKVFGQTLTTTADIIVRAVEWAIAHDVQLINLSLGTLNAKHREKFEQAVATATEHGIVIIAAREMNGQPSLPGCLPAVLGVGLDWECPRDTFRWDEEQQMFFASGYARPIPGVPPERNLNGISFAVATTTGFIARAFEDPGYARILRARLGG